MPIDVGRKLAQELISRDAAFILETKDYFLVPCWVHNWGVQRSDFLLTSLICLFWKKNLLLPSLFPEKMLNLSYT